MAKSKGKRRSRKGGLAPRQEIVGTQIEEILDTLDADDDRLKAAKKIRAEHRQQFTNMGWSLRALDIVRDERKRTPEQLELFRSRAAEFEAEVETYRNALVDLESARAAGLPAPAPTPTPIEAAIAAGPELPEGPAEAPIAPELDAAIEATEAAAEEEGAGDPGGPGPAPEDVVEAGPDLSALGELGAATAAAIAAAGRGAIAAGELPGCVECGVSPGEKCGVADPAECVRIALCPRCGVGGVEACGDTSGYPCARILAAREAAAELGARA